MCSNRSNLPIEDQIIVVLPFRLILKSIKRFTDFNESSFCLCIARIIFRVVFDGQPPKCLFDLIKRGVSRNFKYIIVVLFSFRVVLFEKLLFMGILHPILIIKTLKHFICILKGVLLIKELIIMSSSISIRESLIRFADIIKFYLCVSPILPMPIWMP